MNLMSGLEKFGFGQMEDLDILKEDTTTTKKVEKKQEKEVIELSERDFLLDHKVKCPICDKEFVVKSVKTSKVKRLEPDADLRPNHEYVDTLKYGVCACPRCGYAALNRNFDSLSATQRKWIRESVAANYKPMDEPKFETYSYEYAVEKHKLALVSAMAKKAKLSEKAMICLNIAWLRRSQANMLSDDTPFNKKRREEAEKEFEGFYRQAYEGLQKAASTETPPIAGMDANTVDYILANMSTYYKEYENASKLVGRLLASPNVPRRMKDKCLELKEEIIAEITKG